MVDNVYIVECWVFCLGWKPRLSILVFIQGFKKYRPSAGKHWHSVCVEKLGFLDLTGTIKKQEFATRNRLREGIYNQTFTLPFVSQWSLCVCLLFV